MPEQHANLDRRPEALAYSGDSNSHRPASILAGLQMQHPTNIKHGGSGDTKQKQCSNLEKHYALIHLDISN